MSQLYPPSNDSDHGRTDIERFMGPFPDRDHPFLGTSFDRVTQKHDYVYQLIVHNAPRFILAFGIDYAVNQLIAVRTSGKRGHSLAPDTTFLLSHTVGDNWERILRAGPNRQWFTLGNLEFAKRFDLERDIDQLWGNTQGYRNLFGRKFRLKQRIIITDPPPHELRRKELEICGEHNDDLLHSQCVYIDECSARVLPPEVLNNPFGATGALLCGDGMTEEFMANAITQWYNGGRLTTNPEMNRFVLECLELRPGLIDLYQRVATKLIKEETMANGTHRETTRVSRGFIEALNFQLGVVPDIIHRVPRVRKITQDVTKRVTQDVTKRVTQNVTKRVTQNVTKQVTQNVTKQVTQDVTQKERVKALLDALNARSIKLTPKQRAQLAKIRYQDLPSMQTAVRAKDAADFMRRAKLKRAK